MKTLVIHPKDSTTDFLSVIYADKDWTIIDDAKVSNNFLKEQIKSHDRIIMLGHGTEQGLIAWEGRYDYRHIISSDLVYLLREKKCVCIWCNADVFAKKYELKGFYTGMIISEVDEANLFCVPCKFEDIEQSNVLFAESVRKSIDSNEMLIEMKKDYSSDSNSIIIFNARNLYTA